jgi:branched-chain amino acid transport system substrate-binding protein
VLKLTFLLFFSFLPSGDRNQSIQLVMVKAGKRSGYHYDFTPIANP